MVRQISDNEIYLLIKYTKSVLWRATKCLSYIQDAWCLKVKVMNFDLFYAVLLCEEVLPNIHWIQLFNANSHLSPCTKAILYSCMKIFF